MVKAKLDLLAKEWTIWYSNYNQRMNAIKSVLRLSKIESSPSTIQILYDEVKSWDGVRARILQNHLKVIELAMDALDLKVN